eukprot:13536107-Alexandrium_andersonii.AAC.1
MLVAAPDCNCNCAKARVAGAAISLRRCRRTTRRPPRFGHLGARRRMSADARPQSLARSAPLFSF